jgi:hypothetical protein
LIGAIPNVKTEETVRDEKVLPEIGKVKPFVFDIGNIIHQRVGPFLGKAYSLGERFKI